MNLTTEILLLPAPASPVVGFLPAPRPALLMLPAPQTPLLLPAPRITRQPEQPRVELFWDVPQRTRLPVGVQAALDPNVEQLLKSVELYLGADKANPNLLTHAVADFTAAVQQIGREQCGHKRAERQPSAGRQTKPRARPASSGGKSRSKEAMDAEIGDIVAEHMDKMRAKFGGANGAHAWH